MKKKYFLTKAMASLSALALAFGLTACDEDFDDYDYDADAYEYSDEDVEYDDSEESSSDLSASASGVTGFDGAGNGWTIFVYMCGTDLESFNSMGTDDFKEMTNAENSEDVRFIVQTGGTSEWQNDIVNPENTQRFIVQNGEISLIEEKDLMGMGKEETLGDFVSWGLENFAGEHNGFIMWDHGGGSISGVCVDEMFDCDTLSLREIDNAFSGAMNGKKFDFIGFDACLMGTVETANILEPYALYMYGSEETEPGSGWDYTSIGSYLAQNPDSNGADLGKVVCDSFLQACVAQKDDDLTTLSVIDLAKIADLASSFDAFAGELCTASNDEAARASIIRNIEAAENFGGNNKAEGYTNMVDMGALANACSSYANSADVLKAIDEAVVYSVSGNTHKNASGLSMYYPLSIGGSNELEIFNDISVSKSYSDFISNKTSGYEGSGTVISGEETGESSAITFEIKPCLDEEGIYNFKLDTNGINSAADVYALVYEYTPEGDAMIELGETYDIDGDWNTGAFTDGFSGSWLSLPDGQNLALYIADVSDDFVIYASPISLNGKETNLRIKQDFATSQITVEGAWDGIDENGIASREIIKIKDGDIIVPLYYAYSLDSEDEFTYEGSEFTVSGDLNINYDFMEDGDYLYAFCIDDIYG
ncbi:MAG: hypothetical protein K6G75_05905, partial [Lachnospiraceae bacterium]|nr:hypothetical protein [Lachnospiraceae bacterium]